MFFKLTEAVTVEGMTHIGQTNNYKRINFA